MKFTIYQESRTGKRANNEDRVAYCYSREALLMVVADGMGGHYYGEVAAQIAVQTLTEAFPNESRPRIRDPFMFLQKGMLNAHRNPRLCRQASPPGFAAHHLRRLHRAEQRRLLGTLR
jgi:serine/threonine protein phosphatase PrpC